MVLLKGKQQKPAEVWTGSTNISDGGIHGQTNVGHWVRNTDVAAAVPGLLGAAEARPGRPRTATTPTAKGNKELPRRRSRQIQDAAQPLDEDPERASRRVQPAQRAEVLDMYVEMIDEAESVLHHAGLRHQQGLQGHAEGQHGRRPDHLHAAGEGGQAEPRKRQGPRS